MPETGTGTGGVVENAEQHYRCWGKLYGTTTPVTDDADDDDHGDGDDDKDKAEGTGRGEDRDRGDGGVDEGGQAEGRAERGRGCTAEVVLSGLESTGGSSYM